MTRLWLPILCLTGLAAAQDMEPNLERAARRVAMRLGGALPGLQPVPESLVLIQEPGTDPAVVGALATTLSDEGYRVSVGRAAPAGSGHLAVHVGSRQAAGDLGRMVVSLEEEDRRWVCLYGDAGWVSDVPPGAVQVEGPFQADREAAKEAAFDLAWARLRSRHHLEGLKRSGTEALKDFPHRLIVTHAAVEGGGRVHKAYLQVLPDRRAVRALDRAARRVDQARKREPLLRLGAMALMALVLGLIYVGFDLRTRGYMTGPLRLLFGILFFIGVFACWRITL